MGGDVAAGPPAAPDMQVLLRHTVVGASSDRTLLLVHLLGPDAQFWDAFVRLMSPQRACVAGDLRSAALSPRETTRAVHGMIPGAKFALDKDAAHFLPCQRPDGFARLAGEFLLRARRG